MALGGGVYINTPAAGIFLFQNPEIESLTRIKGYGIMNVKIRKSSIYGLENRAENAYNLKYLSPKSLKINANRPKLATPQNIGICSRHLRFGRRPALDHCIRCCQRSTCRNRCKNAISFL